MADAVVSIDADQAVIEVAGAGATVPNWRRHANGYLLIGSLSVVALVAISILAPFLAPYSPNALNPVQSLQPIGSAGHLLGTDNLGRDVLTRLLYGGQLTLLAGVLASLISTFIGVALGMIAGYFGRWTDTIVMRLLDVLLSFPFILLAILIVAFFGPSTFHALLAIAVANLPFFARIVRSDTLRMREMEFITAARALGVGNRRIVVHHMFPNLVPLVFSTLFMNVGWMISQTSALSFLGLGTQPPTADWGSMLADAQNYMAIRGTVAMLPGLMIVIAVIAFNIFGLGLKGLLMRENGK